MTMGKVEERLWSIIRNFADLGRDRPAMLVNAVRIIELQELVDKSLESSTGGEMTAVEGSTARIEGSLLTSPSHEMTCLWLCLGTPSTCNFEAYTSCEDNAAQIAPAGSKY